MNILTLIQTVRNIVAAVQAKDYGTAFKLILEILNTFAASQDPSIRMMASATATEESDVTAAVAELEACCTPKMEASEGEAAGSGLLVTLLLPVVLALVKKLLGL